MKQAVLVLILLSLTLALVSEETDYRKLLEASRLALAYNPLDADALLNLAYSHMMLGETDGALLQYQKLQQQAPQLSAAAVGVLWAYSVKGDWKQIKQLGQEYLASFPSEGMIHHYLAAAQAYDRKPNLARVGYIKAIALLEKPSLRALPEEGAGWAYLALDDYPAAARHFTRLENPPKPKLAAKLHTGFAIKGSSARFLTLGTTLSHRSWLLNLNAEEMWWKGEHFRWQARVGIRKQLPLIDLNLNLQYLDGKDERIYPGKAALLALSPRIYAQSLIIRPRLAQHFSNWQRHNSYQTDLGVKLSYLPVTLNYTASRIYQDYEAPGADSVHWVHSASTNLHIWSDFWLGAHAGFGNLAFFANQASSYIDDFTAGKGYYGLSLDAPLPGRLLLHLYHQIGIKDHDSYTSLGLSTAF